MARTTTRCPKGVASTASATWCPSPQLKPHANKGAKHVSTFTSWRFGPPLAAASEQNSRNCWRTVWGLRSSPWATTSLTALRAQERASPLPPLPNAKTVAWDLLTWGNWVVTTWVH